VTAAMARAAPIITAVIAPSRMVVLSVLLIGFSERSSLTVDRGATTVPRSLRVMRGLLFRPGGETPGTADLASRIAEASLNRRTACTRPIVNSCDENPRYLWLIAARRRCHE
jgi:hypothetical protein